MHSLHLIKLIFIICCLASLSNATSLDPRSTTNIVISDSPTIKPPVIRPSDQAISTSIKETIQRFHSLSGLTVNVQTQNGVVIYSGKVESDSQATLLIEIAQSTNGVTDVDISKLAIIRSDEPLDEMLITARIKGLLIREKIFGNKDIAAFDLNIETKNGVVYLTGRVASKEQIKNAIETIKSHIRGINRVEYNVTHHSSRR